MSEVIRASNQLCFMSDQFARSPMRQWVQEQADNVSLHNLDFNSFSNLLYGLFQVAKFAFKKSSWFFLIPKKKFPSFSGRRCHLGKSFGVIFLLRGCINKGF